METIVDSTSEKIDAGDSYDKITYTWSDVNVYAATKNDRFWDCIFCKDSKEPIQQKHILKEGKKINLNLKIN